VGAFGKVKLARHEFLGTEVAIKIINKKHIKAAKMVAKVKREIRLLKYFNHPNIIRLYQV
jgi:5'-AMP-activated protein kinase catalytic alpha subunit